MFKLKILATLLLTATLLLAPDAAAAEESSRDPFLLLKGFGRIALGIFVAFGGLAWVTKVGMRGNSAGRTEDLCDYCDAPLPCPEHGEEFDNG